MQSFIQSTKFLSLLAPSGWKEYNAATVRTGVVSHPVSEKGERGGSPSMASNGSALRPNSPVIRKEGYISEKSS